MKDPRNQIYKENWGDYLELGLIPYPASKTYKGPIVPWKNDENGDPLPLPVSDDFFDWEEKYSDANIWVLLGEGFAVIDPDGPGAEDFVKGLNLPECPTSISGNKSVHRWFKISVAIKALKVVNEDGTFIEVRTGALGMMAPPSIHPETGKSYRWMEGHSPWEIPFPELPIEAYEKIRALLPKPEPRMMSPHTENSSLGSLSVERYLEHYGIKFKVKSDGTRTIYAFDRCLFADQHTTKDIPGDSSIIQGSDGKLGYQCFHNHCSLKTWQDARRAISGGDPIIRFFEGYVDRTYDNQKKSKAHKRGEGKTLSQILSEPSADDTYLTKPILARGDKGFVVSTYKTGKTLFLTQWTLSLSMGTPFLGMEIPEPAKVVNLRFELKEHRFQKRLRLMIDAMGGMERVKVEPVFELVRGFNIIGEKDFDWLLGLIQKHRPDVLFLDPLYKICSFDLKDTANAMPLIRRFDTIMELNPNLAVGIAHHLRKLTGDEKESWDSTYGPMFFFADMDFEIRIKTKHRKDPLFTFDHISNDVQVDPFSFKRNPETLLYYVVNPETDHVEEILDHIGTYRVNKTALKDWMMEKLGFSRREAGAVIDRMLEQKRIRWEGPKTRGYLVPVDEDDTYHLPLTTGK